MESTPLQDESSDQPIRAGILSPYQKARVLLVLAACICFVFFWWVGSVVGIPNDRGFQVSLLSQENPAIALIATLFALCAATAVGTIIAGSIRFDAGLFSACLGLCALSARGGPMRCVLQYASEAHVYLRLIGEVIILYILLGIAWLVQYIFFLIGWLKVDSERDGLIDREHTVGEKLISFATMIVVFALLVLFFAQTDRKPQVLGGVGVAAFIAAVVAHYSFPVRPSFWLWVAPLIVAVIGYVWAYKDPTGWTVGIAGNHLANALPLDYASSGTAGAILGYWMSRRWHRDKQGGEEE